MILPPISVTVDDILAAQGADPARVRQRRPDLLETAEQALALGVDLAAPRIVDGSFSVQQLSHQGIELENGGRISGRLPARHLAGALQVRLMLATLGADLDAAVKALIKENPPLGLALDAFGSAAVESLGQSYCQQVRSEAEALGWGASLAISPGMVGWPVASGQEEIFTILKPDPGVIRLTSGWQMEPQKSISKVIGLGPALISQGEICDYCSSRETCAYRDRRQSFEKER